MANPYVGEIRMFGGNFAPAGWMFCDGATLPISENETLFQLIGTTYGGDGEETFQLPNLQSRVPMHAGQGPGLSNNYQLGEQGGVESVTLSVAQIPAHNHPFLGTQAAATDSSPSNALLAKTLVNVSAYGTDAPLTPLASNSLAQSGGSQPHENLQEYLCVNFIISLFGIFPHQ